MNKKMEQLNYHHLRLFWAVAKEGNLTRAASNLSLTPQTVSTQIRNFEDFLGERLFDRVGRGMILTDAGILALSYAEGIFSTGQEFLETLRGQPTGRPLKLIIGITDVLPKLVAHRIIMPALRLEQAIQMICREGTAEELLADLIDHKIDVVLSDAPVPAKLKMPVYGHMLGSCGVTFMGSKALAKKLKNDFPYSLSGAPILLPNKNSVLRRELDAWFNIREIQPNIIGEFDDSALLKVFGQAGEGVFVTPTVIADEVMRQYQVQFIGKTDDVKEFFYAISAERKVVHPAVMAICSNARSDFFT